MKLRAALERWIGKYEPIFYGGLFLAALLVRLSVLNAAPLGEKEAAEAWGALHLLRGQPAASTSALFSSFTAGVLFLTGASHWAPRFFPAIAGALAVFLPLLLRPAWSKLDAGLAAVLIALSPSLWIASAMAGGTTLGFATAGFYILYLRSEEKKPLLGGLALGLAAASGPVGWSGLAIGAIVLLADWTVRMRRFPIAEGQRENPFRFAQFLRSPIGPAGFALGLVAGSTGLFFFPRGLGALAVGISDWASAFFSGAPRLGELTLLFLAYEPIALIFGAAGIILLWKGKLSEEDRFLGLYAAIAGAWVLLRPAAFPDEALWIILPLLLLGARALRSAIESPVLEQQPVFVGVQAGVVAALAVFAVFNLATYEATGEWKYLLLAPVGIIGGLSAGLLFVENGRRDWSRTLAGLAIGWGCLLILAQTAAGWNATHARRASANELWGTEAIPEDVLRLHETLAQISEWQTGTKDELAVVVESPEESALGWELLTYGEVRYESIMDFLATPAMIITPLVEQETGVVTPQLTVVYRGQAFGIAEWRAWSGWPPDIIGWLLYREGPVERGRMILWVRMDILAPDEGAVQ